MPSSEVSKVLASARSESPALGELVQQSSGRVAVIKFDVTDQDSIQKAAVEAVTQLGGKGLDVLINNAGVAYWNPNGIRTM
jgi:NAD(P)-dependent dehydrogenase (short-subunit alcohol dehydrogenase family)